jgi:hypothetical protein
MYSSSASTSIFTANGVREVEAKVVLHALNWISADERGQWHQPILGVTIRAAEARRVRPPLSRLVFFADGTK